MLFFICPFHFKIVISKCLIGISLVSFNSLGMSVLVKFGIFVRKGPQILNFESLYNDKPCENWS